MANWISHVMIADRLLEMGAALDARGLCIGSIAPDCNIENESWTTFDPPREVTHFMTGDSKLTVDAEGFFAQYIEGRCSQSEEERGYLIGYYAHLVTDAACQRFLRDEQRVKASIKRLSRNVAYREILTSHDMDFDALKNIFGKMNVWSDVMAYEERYVLSHPDSLYHRVLRRTADFTDYLGILPAGAIARKLPRMVHDVKVAREAEMLFVTDEELDEFVDRTARRILSRISSGIENQV